MKEAQISAAADSTAPLSGGARGSGAIAAGRQREGAPKEDGKTFLLVPVKGVDRGVARGYCDSTNT
jgi:hypothetical protein